MLSSAKLVGFLFTNDYERSKAFFVERLGFEFKELTPFALVLALGGHTFRIVKIPNFTPARATVMGWEVDDLDATLGWLAERGVSTEKFPFAQDQINGVWTAPDGTRIAWFKDPDGNVLSLSAHAR